MFPEVLQNPRCFHRIRIPTTPPRRRTCGIIPLFAFRRHGKSARAENVQNGSFDPGGRHHERFLPENRPPRLSPARRMRRKRFTDRREMHRPLSDNFPDGRGIFHFFPEFSPWEKKAAALPRRGAETGRPPMSDIFPLDCVGRKHILGTLRIQFPSGRPFRRNMASAGGARRKALVALWPKEHTQTDCQP